jgi:WS/DGAT/MGAT family acyltransferase
MPVTGVAPGEGMVSAPQGRIPLAEVDSAWLRMDDPTNLMVVTGVIVLDEPLTFEQVRETVIARLLEFPRFRQRVVDDVLVGTAHWEPDDRFSLDYHFVQATLPENASEAALQAFVSELMSQPLNPRRPLWQFHFVPSYQGGSALIMRIHHCIGDGLALIYVLLAMADDGPEGPVESPDADSHDGGWEAIARSLAKAVGAVLQVPAVVLEEVNQVLNDPGTLPQQAGAVAANVGALGKLLLMPPDPVTRFKGPLVRAKLVAWSRAVEVDTLKRIGRATGATINDVLMASLSGALRSYLLERDGAVAEDLNVRGVVPVNLRPLDEAYKLGNQFGLVFLALPLGIADPLDRIFEVRKRMTAIKNSPEAHVAFQILRTLGMAPRQLFDFAVTLFGTKATAVVTNVIGPRQPIAFAGRRMRQAMFWVPCAGRLGLGVSLLSYAGQVWLGVQADAALVPDPGALLDGFHRELDAYLELERLAHPQ